MEKPKTTKKEEFFPVAGKSIVDEYLWLENSKNTEVQSWISEQNIYTENSISNTQKEYFLKKLQEQNEDVIFSSPIPVNGCYFYTERKPGEEQSILYFQKEENDEPTVLVNPNLEKNSSLNFWSPGWTGKYLAYGLTYGGTEMATLRILNTETQEHLLEEIPQCRYSSIRWIPNDTGFFYTKHPNKGTVPENEEHLHKKVYFHTLGTSAQSDILIYGENRPIDEMIDLSISLDGKYLAIHASQNWTANDIFLYEIDTKKMIPLIQKIPARFSLQFTDSHILIYTNYKANNYRIISQEIGSFSQDIDMWDEFYPEQEDFLQSVSISKTKILCEYLHNVSSRLIELNHQGKKIDEIALPPYTSVTTISTRRDQEIFFYGIESFLFPKIIYKFNPLKNTYDKYRETKQYGMDPNDYVVKQEWCVSKDGTRIPMFILKKKIVLQDGKNPTLLYGYGGFGSNNTPAYLKNWVPWLAHGGIFVIVNIRGGGEFGEKWHNSGIKNLKQNSFDDFISASQFLISEKYTEKEKLGIIGGSNGGLLVSAVAIQKPTLYKAVCAQVALTDMVRFPRFGMATRWTHEYGNPEIPEDLERILAWSPYHNVKESIDYPAFLFTTGENDTRVDPLHSRKMVAKLQATKSKNKVLLYTEVQTGHGHGKPVSKIIETRAIILSFFSEELGLLSNPS